jgi:hypothetical protein
MLDINLTLKSGDYVAMSEAWKSDFQLYRGDERLRCFLGLGSLRTQTREGRPKFKLHPYVHVRIPVSEKRTDVSSSYNDDHDDLSNKL